MARLVARRAKDVASLSVLSIEPPTLLCPFFAVPDHESANAARISISRRLPSTIRYRAPSEARKSKKASLTRDHVRIDDRLERRVATALFGRPRSRKSGGPSCPRPTSQH